MTQGNGRDQFGGKIAGQEVFLKTTQLLPILILLVGGVGGYLAWQAQDKRFADLAVRQGDILGYLHSQEAVQRERLAMIVRALETHEFNAGRDPDQRLPLILSPGLLQPPPGTLSPAP